METSKAIQTVLVALAIIVFAVILMFAIASLFTTNPDTGKKSSKPYFLDNLTDFVYSPATSPCPIESPDTDDDGILDACDNCPDHYNPEQLDMDLDGKGDMCDDFNDRRVGSGGGDRNDEDEEDVTCSKDSTCGEDVFIGERSCTDGNVTQEFLDFTCINPGKETSQCTNQTITKVVEECEYGCFQGSCVAAEVKCTTNQECGTDGFIGQPSCSDLDVKQTFRSFKCHNPGTADSFCMPHEEERILDHCSDACVSGACHEIQCSSESECGTDGFSGNPFCIGNNLFKLFEDFICIDPGLISSLCDSLVTQKVVQNCEYACSDQSGSCVRCDENPDCDDSNPNTKDICLLPDSILSSCRNDPIPPICSDECSTSGQKQCYNDGYRTCGNFDSDSCLEWSDTTSCSPGEICEAGSCVPEQTCTDICTEGERQCSDNGYKTCHDYNGDGCTEWNTPTLCSFGQVCILGTCVTDTPSCENQCTDGSRRCSGNGYQTCHDYNGDGCTEWNTPTLCSFGKVCISGTCK